MLTDKVSAWGSYWPFGGGESQFKASVGYDISKTDRVRRERQQVFSP